MGVQENKELAVGWMAASLGGDFDRWESMMDPDFRYWNGGKWRDREEYLGVAARLSNQLIEGDYTMDVGSVIAEDNIVCIEAETNYDVQGGGHYQNFYLWVVEIRDGKILSLKGHNDSLHASRIFNSPDVSALGEYRDSPVEKVTQTLKGATPKVTSSA